MAQVWRGGYSGIVIKEEFHAWLKRQQALLTPKSATGMSVRYCLDLWKELKAVTV